MVLSSPKRKENSRLMNLSRNMNVAFPFNCDRHKSETERKFCSQCKISRKIIDRGKYYYQRTRENRGLLSLGMNEGWRLNWAGLTKWQGNRWSDLGLTKMHFFQYFLCHHVKSVFSGCVPFPGNVGLFQSRNSNPGDEGQTSRHCQDFRHHHLHSSYLVFHSVGLKF